MTSQVEWLGAVTRYDWDFYVYQGETLIASLVNGILTDAEAAASKSAIEKKYAAASVCAVRGVAMSGPPRAPIKSPTPVAPPPGKCQIPSAFNQKRTPEPQKVVPSASTMSTKNSVHNTFFDTSLLRPQHVAGVTWVDDHYRQVCPPGHRYDARRDRCLPLVHKLGENSLQDTTFARAALIAWSKHPSSSASSPIADYGNIGTPELLSLAWGMRDSIELRAFRDWWNLSGYKPAAPANTGSGTEVTYPTASDLAALAAWGKEKGVSLPVPFPGGSGGGSIPGGGGSTPPGGGGSTPPGGGGSTPPGGGGGGTTPTQCPAGQILDSAGNCQPALPPAQKTEEDGLSSKTGVILAAGIAVAAIGLFAATVGAAGGAAAAGGGRGENPRRIKKGDRVVAGSGADRDTGVVWEVRVDGTAIVGWDSGVATPADVSKLRLIAAGGGRSNNSRARRQGVPGSLHDYNSGEYLREATQKQTDESIEQSLIDGGAGVIEVRGRSVYVAGGKHSKGIASLG